MPGVGHQAERPGTREPGFILRDEARDSIERAGKFIEASASQGEKNNEGYRITDRD